MLDFCAREKLARLAGLGTSCPDHFLRTKVRPLVLDLPAVRCRSTRPWPACSELHAAYREDYRAYYERHADADSPGHPRRRPGHRAGARASGMFSFGATKQTARVAV